MDHTIVTLLIAFGVILLSCTLPLIGLVMAPKSEYERALEDKEQEEYMREWSKHRKLNKEVK